MINFAEKLAEHQRELMWYKAELEKANKELVMANTALPALARSIEKMRDDLLNKTAFAISSQIMPLIDDICNDKLPERSRVKLDVLVAYLRSMAEGVSSTQDAIPSLSYMTFSAMDARFKISISELITFSWFKYMWGV